MAGLFLMFVSLILQFIFFPTVTKAYSCVIVGCAMIVKISFMQTGTLD